MDQDYVGREVDDMDVMFEEWEPDTESGSPTRRAPFVEKMRTECRSLLRLYEEVLRREMLSRYDDCIVCERSWYKSQPDAHMTSHWDALRAVRDRIEESVREDWRDRGHDRISTEAAV